MLFTENETNTARLHGVAPRTPYVKDAFHEYVVHGKTDAINPEAHGAKAAARYSRRINAGETITLVEGDPSHPPAPAQRLEGRNQNWSHVFSRDVISMPDKGLVTGPTKEQVSR